LDALIGHTAKIARAKPSAQRHSTALRAKQQRQLHEEADDDDRDDDETDQSNVPFDPNMTVRRANVVSKDVLSPLTIATASGVKPIDSLPRAQTSVASPKASLLVENNSKHNNKNNNDNVNNSRRDSKSGARSLEKAMSMPEVRATGVATVALMGQAVPLLNLTGRLLFEVCIARSLILIPGCWLHN
jgi:hypothetical protein